jgi:spermidine/putrescine-binding protein
MTHLDISTLAWAAAAGLDRAAGAQAQGTLNLYNWGNYTPPE